MTATIRGWVSPVDWNTSDYDWNGNPQSVVRQRPVSASVTKVAPEMSASVTLVPGPSATVTVLDGWSAVLDVVPYTSLP